MREGAEQAKEKVEIWLSILVRKLLKPGNFTGLSDLRNQILAFIAYQSLPAVTPASSGRSARAQDVQHRSQVRPEKLAPNRSHMAKLYKGIQNVVGKSGFPQGDNCAFYFQ